MPLRLSQIRFDADCQSRVRLDEETVAEYAYRMKEGASFPPIVVFFDGAEHWLADGFHRYAAWKGLARERGDEENALVPTDVRQGTRIEAVRYALSANAMHGKRREPGDYRKGYCIAVRCGLCDAHDVEAVRRLLACSERWARELTSEARDARECERNSRIVEARSAGEAVRRVAAREGVDAATVSRVANRHTSDLQRFPPPTRPLPAAVAALDRPSLTVWSDALYALEKLIDAIEATRSHRVPPKALPRIRDLIAQTLALLGSTILEAEDDAA